MDALPALTPREKLERAAAEAEAVGDRSAPLLRAMADKAAIDEARDAREEQARAALRTDMREATAAVRENTRRPLLTDFQLATEVLPALLVSVGWGKAIAGAVLLFGAYWIGWDVRAYQEPAFRCGAHWDNGQPFCYRPDPNGQVIIPPAPATQAPTTAPATPATAAGKRK